MKKSFIIASLLMFFVVGTVFAKNEGGVYIMGVSYSFSDTVAYFTEVQFVEGVKLDKKTKFLPHRQHYAYELKDYMSFKENMPGRTSMIYFSKKEASLKKKETKLRNRLQNKDGKVVRYLGDKFRFTKP